MNNLQTILPYKVKPKTVKRNTGKVYSPSTSDSGWGVALVGIECNMCLSLTTMIDKF